MFPHTQCKSTYIFHILLFGLACPPSPLLVVFRFLLVRQTIPPDLTIHTLAVPLCQIYLLHQTPFSFFPYALVILLVSVFVSDSLLVSLLVCARFFLRISPDGGLDNVIVSKFLLTLSFSISFSSSTTLFVRFSLLFPSSMLLYCQLLQYLSV
jgi:hypothetical protein